MEEYFQDVFQPCPSMIEPSPYDGMRAGDQHRGRGSSTPAVELDLQVGNKNTAVGIHGDVYHAFHLPLPIDAS